MTRFSTVLLSFVALLMCGCVSMLGSQRVSVEIPERQNWNGATLHGDIAQIEEISTELTGRYGAETMGDEQGRTTTVFNLRGDVLTITTMDAEVAGTDDAEFDEIFREMMAEELIEADTTSMDNVEVAANTAEAEARVMITEGYTYTYDEDGYLLSSLYSYDGGAMEHRYTLDDYGCVVLDEQYEDSGKLETRTRIIYDDCGNEIERIVENGEGRVTLKVALIYDDANRCVEELRYDEYDELQRRMERKYDAQGRIEEILTFDAYDMSDGSTKYSYGENGRDVEYTVYDAAGEFEERVVERYDVSGNILEHGRYDAEGKVIESSLRTYDEANKLTEVRRIVNGDNLLSVSTYKYDDSGRMIEAVDEDKLYATYLTTVYNYDEQGNLVEERVYSGKKREPQYVIEYVISYR